MTDQVTEKRGYGMLKSFTVDAYVHVITTEAKKNKYPKAQIKEQMKVMNEKYAPSRFQFRTKGIDYTVNDRWATFNGLVDPFETEEKLAEFNRIDFEFKSKLRKGTYSTLNIYFLSDFGDIAFGYSDFPVSNPNTTNFIQDGIVNWGETLPGGEAVFEEGAYNLGYTAVHEPGHWLSLYHVFDYEDKKNPNAVHTCKDAGDYVFNTPAQLTATRGCPEGKDSCPEKRGKDSIHNYMDYSTDPCYTEFTKGQTTRMIYSFAKYRVGR